MNNKIVIISLFIFLGFLCSLSFKDTYYQKHSVDKITIVATTSIIADAVHNIVGDCATVYCLMGPGIDPHLYRARESDVHRLASADIVFYNGLHLEGKMGHVLEGMKRFAKTIAVTNAIEKDRLRKADFEGMYDPHVWFDVALWKTIVEYIKQEIIHSDPVNVRIYQKNGDEYCHKLELLHNDIVQCTQMIPLVKRVLVTAHDAFGYFGCAYDWEVIGLQGLSTDCDISTHDIRDLASYIAEKQIAAIFVETSIAQRSIIALQNAVYAQGWQVNIGDELYSDALGDQLSGAADYVSMIKHNVDSIINSLGE